MSKYPMSIDDSTESARESGSTWKQEEKDRLHARLIEEDFDIFEGARVFEVTVGDRSLASRIAEHHEEISICSMDLSDPTGTTDCTDRALTGLPTDALFPLPPDSYDRGYCYLSLATLARDRIPEVLREAFRVLKEGGRFRFAVPDRENPDFEGRPEGTTGYTRAEIFSLVEETIGFRVVSMRRFDPEGPRWEDQAGSHFLFDVRKPPQN